MHELERILVGLDFAPGGDTLSAGSQRAVEQALWIAEESFPIVDCLHSTEEREYVDSDDGSVVVHCGLSRERRAVLDAVVARFADAQIRSQLLVRQEKPWMELIRETLRHGAGLVVVGKHNDLADGRRLAGVPTKLLRKCPTPLWVAKADCGPIPRRILVATGLSEVGARAIEYAGWVARKAKAELHVVHAYQLTMGEQMHREDLPDAGRRAEDAVRAQVRAAGVEQLAELHVGCTTPVRGILSGVEHLRPDLLVMGTLARGGVPGFLIGNTPEKVLSRVDCSLLTVKPESFLSPITLPEDEGERARPPVSLGWKPVTG